MRDYGKVYGSFWQSPEIRALPEDARTLALYLLTTPHGNLLGCFRMPDGYVVEDLQWSFERVREGFAKLSENRFVTRDEGSQWLVIEKFVKWNAFENPNVAKSAERLFGQIPSGEPKLLLAKAILEFGAHISEGFRKGCETLLEPFGEPFRSSFRKPEPNQSLTKPFLPLPSVEGSGAAPFGAAPPTSLPGFEDPQEAPPPPRPPPPFDGTNEDVLNGKAVVFLADSFALPASWGMSAEALGFKPAEIRREAEKFRQHWTEGRGKGSRRSVKGWRQTWSNWLERASRDYR